MKNGNKNLIIAAKSKNHSTEAIFELINDDGANPELILNYLVRNSSGPRNNITKTLGSILENYKTRLSQRSLNDALKIANKMNNWNAANKLIKAGANPEIILSKALNNAQDEDVQIVLNSIFENHKNGTKKLSQTTLNKALKQCLTNHNDLGLESFNPESESPRTKYSKKLIEAGANPQIFHDTQKEKQYSILDPTSTSNKNINSFLEEHYNRLYNNIDQTINNLKGEYKTGIDYDTIAKNIIKLSLNDNPPEKIHAWKFLKDLKSEVRYTDRIIISEEMKGMLNDLPVDYAALLLYELSLITSKEVMNEAFSKNAAWQKVLNFNNKIEQEMINLSKNYPSVAGQKDGYQMIDNSAKMILKSASFLTLTNNQNYIMTELYDSVQRISKNEYSIQPSWIEKFIEAIGEAVKTIFVKKEIFSDRKIFLENHTPHSTYIKNINEIFNNDINILIGHNDNNDLNFSLTQIQIIEEFAKLDKKCHGLTGVSLNQEIEETSEKIHNLIMKEKKDKNVNNEDINRDTITTLISGNRKFWGDCSKFIDQSEQRKEFYGASKTRTINSNASEMSPLKSGAGHFSSYISRPEANNQEIGNNL